jgi:SPP1 gp7 family putative phage head morphogenesis protein
MPEPIIVRQVKAFRIALQLREDAQQREMVGRWLSAERNLQTQLRSVLEEIERRRASGEVIGRGMNAYHRMERYQELLRQVRSEIAKYAAYLDDNVREEMLLHAELGAQQSAAQLGLLANAPELAGVFNRLNTTAIENIVGALQDDAPVGELLRRAWPEASVRMTDALINGVALGWNPRKTELAMRGALQNTVLNRALTIARTEQLRAHRMATQENYQQNGVTQYMRVASKSGRTCIACLVADGTIYEVDHIFDAHPNCRCTMIPLIAGREIPRFTKGRDWLESQSPAVQQRIMGKAAHAAWKDGAITLGDMVGRHEHPVWGGSLQRRSLRSILGADEAQRWIDEMRNT